MMWKMANLTVMATMIGAFERMLNVEDIISNWKVNLPVRAQSCLEHFASNLERHDLRRLRRQVERQVRRLQAAELLGEYGSLPSRDEVELAASA